MRLAILNNAVVNGSIRCLNKIYAKDMQLSGSMSVVSLSTTANIGAGTYITATTYITAGSYITANGNFFSNAGRLYLGAASSGGANRLAIRGDPNDSWLRINTAENGGGTSFASGVYFGTSKTRTDGELQVGPDGIGFWSNQQGAVAKNLNVVDTLRATRYDLQTITQTGGCLYVSPTLRYPNSNTTVAVTNNGSSLTMTITDGGLTSNNLAGIAWQANNRVKVSGTFTVTKNGVTKQVATGTMDGYLQSGVDTTNHKLVITNLTGNSALDVETGNYGSGSFSNLSVACYTIYDGSKHCRVGIWINSYEISNVPGVGTENIGALSAIRIYGGTDVKPTVALGNLQQAGLGQVNGEDVGGWGIYTQRGYFQGTVVTTKGKIGRWNITDTSINTGSGANIAGMGGNQAFWCGSSTSDNAPFRVGYTGLVVSTYGLIAGWRIDSTSIRTNDVAVTSNADNSIALSSADFTRTISGTSRAGLRFAIGDKFGVTGDGALYASSATISGSITAISGTIGGCSISNGVLQVANANITSLDASKINAGTIAAARIAAGSISADKLATSAITVGGRNVLMNTRNPKSQAVNVASSYAVINTYYTDTAQSSSSKQLSACGFAVGDPITISFDWEISSASTYGNFRIEYYGTKSDGTYGYIAAFGTVPIVTLSSSNTKGHVVVTDTINANTLKTNNIRIRVDNSVLTLKISNMMLERANRASGWSEHPDEMGGWIIDGIQGLKNSDSSVFLAPTQKSVTMTIFGKSYTFANSLARFGNTLISSGGINTEQLDAKKIYIRETKTVDNASKDVTGCISCDPYITIDGGNYHVYAKSGNDKYDVIDSCYMANNMWGRMKFTVENTNVNVWGPANHFTLHSDGEIYVSKSAQTFGLYSFFNNAMHRDTNSSAGVSRNVVSGRMYFLFLFHNSSDASTGLYVFKGGLANARAIKAGSNITVTVTTTTWAWTDSTSNNPTPVLFYI